MDEERHIFDSSTSRTWSRHLCLQALALAVDHLQRETTAAFSLSLLLTNLMNLEAFGTQAEQWLATALKERIILTQLETTGMLNRRHPLVQKALLIRERILTTLSIIQGERELTPFVTLERAIRTCLLCA